MEESGLRLVDDLLDLTRIARGKLQLRYEVSDAHAALRNAVSMFQADIDAKWLAVTLALRAKDHHVWADGGRLQQVFLNLLSNAIKSTPEEGSIALSGFGQDDDLRRSREAGFELLLTKPINFQTLREVILKIAG